MCGRNRRDRAVVRSGGRWAGVLQRLRPAGGCPDRPGTRSPARRRPAPASRRGKWPRWRPTTSRPILSGVVSGPWFHQWAKRRQPWRAGPGDRLVGRARGRGGLAGCSCMSWPVLTVGFDDFGRRRVFVQRAELDPFVFVADIDGLDAATAVGEGESRWRHSRDQVWSRRLAAAWPCSTAASMSPTVANRLSRVLLHGPLDDRAVRLRRRPTGRDRPSGAS